MSDSADLRHLAGVARYDGREADARTLERIADNIEQRASPTTEGEGGDMIKRLREIGAISANWSAVPEAKVRKACREAADAIERLSSPVDARREALEEAAKALENRGFWRDESGEKAAGIVRALKEAKP